MPELYAAAAAGTGLIRRPTSSESPAAATPSAPAARPADQRAPRRRHAQRAGRQERRLVGAEPRAARAGAPRRERAAQLVAGEDPGEDDAHALRAEAPAHERDGRRHRRHPVEAVEDDEGDE